MRFLLPLVLAASLAACAAPNPAVAEWQSWALTTKAKVDRGEMPFSAYYTEAYDRLARLPGSDPGRTTMMRLYAELIPVARSYEAGAISKERFDDARRAATIALQQYRDVDTAERQRAAAAAIQEAAESIRANAATYQVIQPPRSINCTSNRVGTSVFTNCN